METKDEVIILAAGDFPTRPDLVQRLAESPRVVCCDSAAEAFVAHFGRYPWRIVGDLDSLSPELREACAEIVVHIAEQESNDLSKAVHFARSQGLKRITIFGATGRREDHTLGNISLLIDYMREGLSVQMFTDYGRFIPCRDRCCQSSPVGTQVSIFSFGAAAFRGEGLRYLLHDFTNWWQGTLNETIAPEWSVEASGEFLVYVCDEH